MAKSAEDKIRDGQVWTSSMYDIAVGAMSTLFIGITTLDKFARISSRTLTTTSSLGVFAIYRNTPYTGGTEIGVNIASANQRRSASSYRPPITVLRDVSLVDPINEQNLISTTVIRSSNNPVIFKVIDNELDTIFLEKETSYVLALSNLKGGQAVFDIDMIGVSEAPQPET